MVKRNIMKVSSAAFFLLVANSAMASQGSIELKVKGGFSAPSCQIGFNSGGGTVDLGRIDVGMIKENNVTKLPEAPPVLISAQCDASTALTFSVIDNRSTTVSSPSPKNFGLGAINGNGKIGYYNIKLSAGHVDGKASKVYSSPNKDTFTPTSEADVQVGHVMGWANSANQQLFGKDFVAALYVTPYLASSKDMGGPAPESTLLDGSATLNFSYSI